MKPRDGEESRGPKKDLATETEISGESEQTKPILEKTDAPITVKKKIPEKKGISGFLSKLFGK